MPQRGTMTMVLFSLASLISFAGAIYSYAQGRGVDWYAVLFGVASACAGVYFKTVKRPT
jgi:hypothetical protein